MCTFLLVWSLLTEREVVQGAAARLVRVARAPCAALAAAPAAAGALRRPGPGWAGLTAADILRARMGFNITAIRSGVALVQPQLVWALVHIAGHDCMWATCALQSAAAAAAVKEDVMRARQILTLC